MTPGQESETPLASESSTPVPGSPPPAAVDHGGFQEQQQQQQQFNGEVVYNSVNVHEHLLAYVNRLDLTHARGDTVGPSSTRKKSSTPDLVCSAALASRLNIFGS